MFSASKTTAPSSGYNLTKSLRFRSSAGGYLNRTPSTSSNRKTYTFSAWVKRGALSSDMLLLSAGASDTTRTLIYIDSANTMRFLNNYAGAGYVGCATNAVLRDPSSWYHLIYAIDTTQATAANRVKLYINGVQQTTTTVTITQNEDTYIDTGGAHYIGRSAVGQSSTDYFDGEMTEINFIDGQALTPSSFGENNADTGVWQPKKYTGTYGTNGFYLPFTNTTSTTTLGYDFSGNSNNWTTNNISLTAGSTYDSMTDVPTLTDASTANYCVVNPLKVTSSISLSDGNLKIPNLASGLFSQSMATIGVGSGKWYFEATVLSSGRSTLGISKTANSVNSDWVTGAGAGNTYVYYGFTGYKYNGSTGATYGATWTTGDVIGVAYDLDSGSITFYKNNSSQGVAFTWTPDGSLWSPVFNGDSTNSAAGFTVNFGQQPFTYTPPTGYVALNTYNLPTSTIVKGNKYMDATLYTGNGSTQSITNAAGFKPDLVWGKDRGDVISHNLYDSVRGPRAQLSSNLTNAEVTRAGDAVTFNSNGFGLDAAYNNINNNGQPEVAWQWQAGQGTTSTNTNGSVTSTVSVNATAGFSVLTYTGNGTVGATVGHGLGIAPQFILFKNRTNAIDWGTYHVSAGNTGFLSLDSTAAVSTATTTFLNSTTPSSSVITLGNGNVVNQSTINYVAYCWAEIAGFSKFGSYTGNGSADGPFVYTGFRPKFIMLKIASGGTGNWEILDTSRNTYNVADLLLLPSSSNAESSSYGSYYIDFVSNGFKIRGSGSGFNGSGEGMIYAAFAENPFKNALAR